MLFSYRVKNELARIVPKNIYEQKDELLAFIKLRGNVTKKDQKIGIIIILEDPAITRTAYNLIKKVFKIYPVVKTEHLSNKKKHYIVKIPFLNESKKILKEMDLSWGHSLVYNKQAARRERLSINNLFSKESYLRGAFLVNRLVNCETANLDKTVLSAAKQLHSIDITEKKIGLQNISSKLAMVAKIRKKLPYASLQELVEEADFEITKSGIYHQIGRAHV